MATTYEIKYVESRKGKIAAMYFSASLILVVVLLRKEYDYGL